MVALGLKVNLSFVLSIALVVSAMPWICLAEDEKQENTMTKKRVASSLDLAAVAGWKVIVDAEAIASERYAAEEFVSLFEQAAGVKLPVVSGTAGPTGNVFIGPGAAMADSAVGFGVDDLGEEGLRINIQKDNIAIAGGRPRGTLYGVYEFFEKYLQVRFLTPDHTHVPDVASVGEIPCQLYSYVPVFSLRYPFGSPSRPADPLFTTRVRDNTRRCPGRETVSWESKLGGVGRQSQIRGGGFARMVPVDKYGKDHPEYFAMVNGVRKITRGKGGPQLCVTNPELIELVAEGAIRFFDEHPDADHFNLSANDNAFFCGCEKCQAINVREDTPMGSHLYFVNAVAERVEKRYPDKKVATEAYLHTRKAPRTIVPRDNVQILLAPIEACGLHGYDDPGCPRNYELGKYMAQWEEICDDLWLWGYYTNFGSYALPFPNLKSISARFRFFQEHKVQGILTQNTYRTEAGEFSDLRYYVLSRCLWDPRLDSWALTEEFCRLHYSKAAQPIIDHLTMIHEDAERLGGHPFNWASPAGTGLGPENTRKSLAYFAEAMDLADNQVVRSRVEKASLCAYAAMLETPDLVFADGKYRLDLPSQYSDVFHRYIDIAKRHNLTRMAEGIKAADYFEQIERLAKGYPAVCLEDSTWRLVVLPENNGQMVEMTYKPTGRNLLRRRTWSSGEIADFVMRSGSVHEETGLSGYEHERPRAFTVDSAKQTSLILIKHTADDSVIVRRIYLSDQDPSRICFQTTITNQGAGARTYQIKVCPELNTATDPNDWTFNSDVVAGYVKRTRMLCQRWVKFNDDWGYMDQFGLIDPRSNFGPNDYLLKSDHGGLAYFNHRAKFGVLQSYNPEEIDSLNFQWEPVSSLVNLELITRAVELRSGESFDFSYQMEYLTEPPL